MIKFVDVLSDCSTKVSPISYKYAFFQVYKHIAQYQQFTSYGSVLQFALDDGWPLIIEELRTANRIPPNIGRCFNEIMDFFLFGNLVSFHEGSGPSQLNRSNLNNLKYLHEQPWLQCDCRNYGDRGFCCHVGLALIYLMKEMGLRGALLKIPLQFSLQKLSDKLTFLRSLPKRCSLRIIFAKIF